MSTPFENVTCGRCGGTGHYSFNLIDGTRCYGCNGKGWKLTKRGAAAKAVYENALMVAGNDVTPGMYIWSSFYGKFFKVVSVDYEKRIIYTNGLEIHYNEDKLRRKPVSTDEYNAIVSRALEYQNTLTKQGKPKKGTLE